jgi:hypothetical protein
LIHEYAEWQCVDARAIRSEEIQFLAFLIFLMQLSAYIAHDVFGWMVQSPGQR